MMIVSLDEWLIRKQDYPELSKAWAWEFSRFANVRFTLKHSTRYLVQDHIQEFRQHEFEKYPYIAISDIALLPTHSMVVWFHHLPIELTVRGG